MNVKPIFEQLYRISKYWFIDDILDAKTCFPKYKDMISNMECCRVSFLSTFNRIVFWNFLWNRCRN